MEVGHGVKGVISVGFRHQCNHSSDHTVRYTVSQPLWRMVQEDLPRLKHTVFLVRIQFKEIIKDVNMFVVEVTEPSTVRNRLNHNTSILRTYSIIIIKLWK